MNTVQVGNVVIGEGIPKICTPLAGRNREALLLQIKELKAAGPDLAEWRVDWFEKALEEKALREMLGLLRRELGKMPILVTFRTGREGGEQEISPEAYEEFLERTLASGQTDMVDVELFMGDGLLERIVKKAHMAGVKVVASSHDFAKTPSAEEIIERLCRMQDAGADLLKLAAMPQNAEDVLTLLSATLEMKERYARQPVITMSMGGTGVLSRISGEVFGSALTFGSAGQASAPGQVGAKELRRVLELLHRGILAG